MRLDVIIYFMTGAKRQVGVCIKLHQTCCVYVELTFERNSYRLTDMYHKYIGLQMYYYSYGYLCVYFGFIIIILKIIMVVMN